MFCSLTQPPEVVCRYCGRPGVHGKAQHCTAGQPIHFRLRPCIHQGVPPLREDLIPCKSCQGNVRLKKYVYSCSLQEIKECIPGIEGVYEGVQGCLSCQHYSGSFPVDATVPSDRIKP